MNVHQKALLNCVATLIFFTPLLATAQQVLEEIVITATMRAETLQDVPISVSAVTSEDIEAIGAQKLQDISRIVPNFQMGEDPILDSIAIRGIDTGGNQGFDQAVGTFRDGVYAGKNYLSRLPFLDVQRIEVVRGPQGTLFGRSAIGGALAIISNDPGDEFEFGGRAQVAVDRQDYEGEGFVTGPLSPALRGRVAARYRDSNGFVTNIAENRKEPQLEEYAVRGALQWDITGTLTATLKYEHADWLTEGRSVQIFDTVNPLIYQDGALDKKRAVSNRGAVFDGTGRESESVDSNADFLSLKLVGDIGALMFESTTGYTAYEVEGVVDGDFNVFPAVNNIPGEDYEQFSQEVRLLSPASDQFNWVAGVYYETNEFQMREEIETLIPQGLIVPPDVPFGPFPPLTVAHKFSTDFDQDEDNISVFGQATYDLIDSLRVTAGLRYTHTKKEAVQAQFFAPILPAGNRNALAVTDPLVGLLMAIYQVTPHSQAGVRKENRLDWSANLEYDFVAGGEHTAYVAVAQGSKAGGFDARATAESPAYEFKDETAINYELGLKSAWLDGAMDWNWAFFHTDYQDLQSSLFGGVLTQVVGNAASVDINGFETDMRWQVASSLSVWGNLAYLDFEYSSFPGAGCPVGHPDRGAFPPKPCDLSGVSGFTPEWSGAFGANLAHPVLDFLKLLASVTVTYSDGQSWEPGTSSPLLMSDSVTKVDAQVGVGGRDGSWAVQLLGSNLTDEISCGVVTVVPLSQDQASFCGTEPTRTFYLQASYNY